MKTVRWAVLAGCVIVAGCSSGEIKLAKVSGKVTLDGKPLPNAYVMFQPIGSADNPNPGRGSMAVTDGEGKFSLRYDGGVHGAVIGMHQVRITTVQEADNKALYEKYKDTGTPDGDIVPDTKGIRPEVIPREWNADTKQEFEVKSGGTESANFNIVSKKAAK